MFGLNPVTIDTKSNREFELPSLSIVEETIVQLKKDVVGTDSIQFHKVEAVKYSREKNVVDAVKHINEYVKASGDLNFINQHEFEPIQETKEYQEVIESYKPKLSLWALFFLFSAVIGVFISIILNFQNNVDRGAHLLIVLFVFFHSIMIGELGLYFSNYRFEFPHSLFVSRTFSFLYGPLLYFYFKRTTIKYKFRIYDTVHLIPSIVLFIYIFPYYLLNGDEKLFLMLNFEEYLMPGTKLIFLLKLLSLIVYAILIYNVCRKSLKDVSVGMEMKKWQKRISNFFNIYVFSYLVYYFSFLSIINLPYLFYVQGGILSCLVLYIAYNAFTNPIVFLKVEEKERVNAVSLSDSVQYLETFHQKDKYQKSGLTPDFSLELKENLLRLLNEKKVFKANDITLELLSQKLNANRHNTSQVINEHFKMNFFELINHYRVREAMRILESDSRVSMNIIDIAYEVGYNNKVTFNKSFKKETLLTPSHYREIHKRKRAGDDTDFIDGGSNLFSGSGT